MCQDKSHNKMWISYTSFERKLRDGNQEGNNEKFKIDKVFLCKPLLSSLGGAEIRQRNPPLSVCGNIREFWLSLRENRYWRQSIKTRHIKGYVFCKLDGSRFIDVNGAFRSALKKAKITDFHFHDLRHTFASHWIMRGGSIKGLQQILGHADIKMTMRYSHLSKEFQKDEIKILEGLTKQNSSQAAMKIH